MSVIKDSLGEVLGVRGMQKWSVLFPRTLEVTHLRQWLTLLKSCIGAFLVVETSGVDPRLR